MADAVFESPIGNILLSDGKSEVTVIEKDPESGVICKIRADMVPSGHDVIVDLKTVADITTESIRHSSGEFLRHVQGALYERIWKEATGEKRRFVWVFVCSEPPHYVRIMQMEDVARQDGKMRINAALKEWKRCEDSGLWPGPGWDWDAMEYTIEDLDFPPYSLLPQNRKFL